MRKNHPEQYKILTDFYKSIFPFIDKINIKLARASKIVSGAKGVIPNMSISHKGIKKPIQWTELSSGMIKTLLILTDILTAPNESVILIDEYENSLGFTTIDFFPDFINIIEKRIQYFITSHHPYLINKIPRKNWYLLHRGENKINIIYGEDLLKRYSKSKQQAFIQLINDPIYVGDE